MSERPKQVIGEVVWRDLTVDDASGVRDFYAEVVGWKTMDMEMPAPEDGPGAGEVYSDYVMQSVDPDGEVDAVGGVCHARGGNRGIPPQWLLYVRVADLDASVAAATARGGEVLHGPRSMGNGSMAVVRDPAGAVLGLWAD
ncbi:MAG: VOC family protein [Planctomycetota bacterium]|nr:VOC family protein [Planctomycetota bacterium]